MTAHTTRRSVYTRKLCVCVQAAARVLSPSPLPKTETARRRRVYENTHTRFAVLLLLLLFCKVHKLYTLLSPDRQECAQTVHTIRGGRDG